MSSGTKIIASWEVTACEEPQVGSILTFLKLEHDWSGEGLFHHSTGTGAVYSELGGSGPIIHHQSTLVQSTIQANATSFLSQPNRRIAAALKLRLKAQGLGSSLAQELQPRAQHNPPQPVTSIPVAPVPITPSQNTTGEQGMRGKRGQYG